MAISVYTSLLLKDYKRKAGEIKALRKELREANGVPVGNATITDYVIEKGNLAIDDRTALMATRLSVRKRLKNLAAAGKVVGHHDKKTNTGASWTLPSRE